MNNSLLYIYNIFVSILPSTRCFVLKRFFLKLCGVNIGQNVRICSSVRFYGSGILNIGDNVWIGHNVSIISSSQITIGNNVDIAPEVFITTGSHEIDKDGLHTAGKGVSKDVIIEDGVWICSRSVILPGVKIGRKSVIAAGGVVTKNVEDMSLYGGVPAKFIKKI